MLHAILVLPLVTSRLAVGRTHKWEQSSGFRGACSTWRSDARDRKPRSPSMDKTVASGFASVTARTACPTQSTPALVERANWKGEQASSTSLPLVPVAVPRTLPSRFCSAVMEANMKRPHGTWQPNSQDLVRAPSWSRGTSWTGPGDIWRKSCHPTTEETAVQSP